MRISRSFSRPFTAWAIALIFRLLCLLMMGAVWPGRGWQFYATDPEAYQADRDITVFHSGKSSAHLRSNAGASPSGFGLFWQKVDARKYRGQRLRLSGYLRTSGVSGWAGLWLRIDPKSGPALEFENMQRRPIVGSNGWKSYSIELDVAQLAEEIHFGFLLVGSGEVWFDDVKLEPVGPLVPGAEQVRRARNLPLDPVDPGFEDGGSV